MSRSVVAACPCSSSRSSVAARRRAAVDELMRPSCQRLPRVSNNCFNQLIERARRGRAMTTLLGRLGRGAASHPWRALAGFVLALLVVRGVAGGLGAGFTDEVRLGDTDSQQASDVLTERFPAAAGDTATLVFHTTGRLDTAA